MIQLEIQEFQANLAGYLNLLAKGEPILLCRDQKPVAELHPIPSKPNKIRQFGMGKDLIQILPGAFDPLPPDILAGFYGEQNEPN